MINRMLCGLAALFGALVMALGLAVGTASAEEADYPEWEPELSVTLADCQVTVQANSIPYHVTSGTRTAGLAIRVNEEIVEYTRPEAMDDRMGDEFYEFTKSLSFGPVVDGDLVEFRWFAGPDRSDLPPWNTADHPDWADTVAERRSIEGRHWDARDSAPFVTWYTFGEITGCPAPSTDPTTPPASPSPDPTGEPLPVTSGVRLLPVLLISGFALIGAGAGIYYATRRKMDPTL